MSTEKKYIPINKGQFALDTQERKIAFSNKLSEGWKDGYKDYRNQWGELPLKSEVRDYPLHVDLELASICNLKCPMCYTVTESFKKKVRHKLMNFDLFKKIIDEIAGKVYAIRLSLRGEPTLHPKYIEAIRYAKEKGIKEVSSLTNGSKLDLDYFIRCAEAGIDWFSISIDGLGDEYNKIRAPMTFDEIYGKLKAISDYKKEKKLKKPVIKVQGIWPSIKPDPTRYYETLSPVCDYIAFNPLIDYLSKDTDIVYEENFSCSQIYQRLTIGSDGRAMMCANDEDTANCVGDTSVQTIHDIWHGEKMQAVRELHKKKDGFKCINVCKNCYYPRKTEVNELSEVSGRRLEIENYINRKQTPGE